MFVIDGMVMRRRISRAIATLAMAAGWIGVNSASVAAQRGSQASFGNTPAFLIDAEAGFGAPQRASCSVALILPLRKWTCDDGFCGGRHLEIQANGGAGGWRAAGGLAILGYPFRSDLLFTVSRTSSSPRGASSDSTYAGVEGGFAIPVFPVGNRSFLNVRPAIGVAHRMRGPAGRQATVFTWSVGVGVLWPKM